MSLAAPPLIARLRRRLVTTVWLLALVVLGQSTLASLCLADGLTLADQDSALTVEKPVVDATTLAGPDHATGPCWHAGSGGCHCVCMHGLALPVIASDWAASLLPAAHGALPSVPSRHLLLPPLLRPPIA
jgi:hypothetical protein